MAFDAGPQPLGRALTELIALRGYARQGAASELEAAWSDVAGAEYAERTRAVSVKRGVLQVHVGNSVLLAELNAYHRDRLIQEFAARYPKWKVKDVKFKLESGTGRKR